MVDYGITPQLVSMNRVESHQFEFLGRVVLVFALDEITGGIVDAAYNLLRVY